MIFLKIILDLVTIAACGYLKNRGEIVNHNYQRFILPAVYGLSVSLNSWCWWVGLTSLPMIGAICLGYDDYGPNKIVNRFLWLAVICLAANLGECVTGHLVWWIFAPAVLLAGTVGTLIQNQNNKWASWVNGVLISWPILFIHGA